MSSRTSRALWELTKGERKRYAYAAVVLVAAIGAGFSIPLILKQALDHLDGAETILGDSESGALWVAGALIVAATAVAGVFAYLRGRFAAIASERIVRELRDRIYKHLGRLPATYHDKVETGDLLQRCSSDVETVRVFLAAQVVEIARAAVMLASVIPLLVVLHAKLALISLSLMPVIVVFALWFFRSVRKLFLKQDEAEGRMTAVLQENLTGIRVVRAFARQEFEQQKFDERNAEFRDTNYKLMRLMANYWGMSDVLCIGQIGICVVVGSHFMLAGEISVGTFTAFFTSVGMVIWPVRNLGRVLTDTGKATVAIGRIDEVLKAERESAHEEVLELPVRGALTARGLQFGFGGETAVLQGLDFDVEPGETLAILGPPGSGKTAIVSVLLRLYDYDAGSLKLDGRELNTLSRRFVRQQIGVVLQEPFLYSKSVGANVRVGRADASQYEVEASTTDACVHHSIQDFEQGYETLVGERGVTLSGGTTSACRARPRAPEGSADPDSGRRAERRGHEDGAAHPGRPAPSPRQEAPASSSRTGSPPWRTRTRSSCSTDGRVVQAGSHETTSGERGRAIPPAVADSRERSRRNSRKRRRHERLDRRRRTSAGQSASRTGKNSASYARPYPVRVAFLALTAMTTALADVGLPDRHGAADRHGSRSGCGRRAGFEITPFAWEYGGLDRDARVQRVGVHSAHRVPPVPGESRHSPGRFPKPPAAPVFVLRQTAGGLAHGPDDFGLRATVEHPLVGVPRSVLERGRDR